MAKNRQMNLEMDQDMFEDIETMATRYTGGNKSEYIRRLVIADLDREAREMVI